LAADAEMPKTFSATQMPSTGAGQTRNPKVFCSRQGSVLFFVVLMLVLLSILGFSAMHTSTVERLISTNELLHQKNFFAAEAGIAYAILALQEPFASANAARVAAGIAADWDFALVDAGPEDADADEYATGDELGQGSYERAVIWNEGVEFSGSRFDVTLWNNDESAGGGSGGEGNERDDRDGRIWVRSDATGPRGGMVAIRVLLQSEAPTTAVIDYPAQFGAGAGKNYNVNDLEPIDSFQPQR